MEPFKDPSITSGTTIGGKYLIARRIGSGGMGVVYEAEHTAISRRVAIKLLRLEYSNDPKAVARFEQEARAAGAIEHSGICEVIDFGVANEQRPFMVMPLLKGTSLANVLKGGRLEVSRAVDIVSQVLDALEAAHRASIVHRDLKPDNIFLTRMGDRVDFVKILDFGISKIMNRDKIVELTRTGSVIGTPHYMAPEQARGTKQLDHRVDIYAVGVILYQLLTGKRPFEAENYNELIIKLATEQFKPPRAIEPGIDMALEAVILKALARDCTQRFDSAREMRAALLEDGSFAQAVRANSEAGDETKNVDSMTGPTLPTGVDTGSSTLSSAVREETVSFSKKRRSAKSRWLRGIAGGALGLLIALGGARLFDAPVHESAKEGLRIAWTVSRSVRQLCRQTPVFDEEQLLRLTKIAPGAAERSSPQEKTVLLEGRKAARSTQKKRIRASLSKEKTLRKAKVRAGAAKEKNHPKVGYGRFGTMIFSDYGE